MTLQRTAYQGITIDRHVKRPADKRVAEWRASGIKGDQVLVPSSERDDAHLVVADKFHRIRRYVGHHVDVSSEKTRPGCAQSIERLYDDTRNLRGTQVVPVKTIEHYS